MGRDSLQQCRGLLISRKLLGKHLVEQCDGVEWWSIEREIVASQFFMQTMLCMKVSLRISMSLACALGGVTTSLMNRNFNGEHDSKKNINKLCLFTPTAASFARCERRSLP